MRPLPRHVPVRPAGRRLQQAPTGRAAAGQTPDPGLRQGNRLLARHRVDLRLRASALRDATAHVVAAMLEIDARLVRERPGLLLITDKGFASRAFERSLSEQGITPPLPSMKREAARPGEPMLKKVRRLIESVDDTLKGRLDHGGVPPVGDRSGRGPHLAAAFCRTRPGVEEAEARPLSRQDRVRHFR